MTLLELKDYKKAHADVLAARRDARSKALLRKRLLASCGADGYELAKLVLNNTQYDDVIDLARRIVKKVEGGK